MLIPARGRHYLPLLIYKCQKNGKDLQILDERDTSKTCSGCGNMQPMPLYKRAYRCAKCGLVMDRDENSAYNIRDRYFLGLAAIIQWYFARLGPHMGDPMRCTVVFTGI